MKKPDSRRNTGSGKYRDLIKGHYNDKDSSEEAKEFGVSYQPKPFGLDDYPDPYDAPPREDLTTWKNKHVKRQHMKHRKT